MKTLITLFAFVGLLTNASAQSTAKDAPKKTDVQKVDKIACDGKAKADGKPCCAGKGDAKASTASATEGDTKTPACCAGKAASGKGCDHARAEAGHEHGAMKAHACTEACKEGTHAYACGEEGHTCSADCHAKM